MSNQGMRIQSVRFSEIAWARIQKAAREQGVSASQYVRESALARVWFELGESGGEEAQQLDRFFESVGLVSSQNGSD
jgi:hypothetical protein